MHLFAHRKPNIEYFCAAASDIVARLLDFLGNKASAKKKQMLFFTKLWRFLTSW